MSLTEQQAQSRLLALVEASLEFEYLEGDTRDVIVSAHPQRTYPFATVGQIQVSDCWIESGDLERVRLRPDDGYLLRPGIPYSYSTRTRRAARFVWAHVNYRVFNSLNLFQLLPCPIRFPPTVGDVIGDINQQLHAFTGARAMTLREIAAKKELGYRLLRVLLESSEPVFDPIEKLSHLQRLLPLLTFIHDHLAEKITRPLLANMIHLSETHFHVYFKRALGLAPMEYVQEQRMRKAQQLLLQTNDSIAAIGAQVGYSDPFYFSRQFRAVVSINPTEFRRHRKQMIW